MSNVLICDDDKTIVDSVEVYLKIENYNVFKAYDGYQAIQIAQTNDIDCIIMDLMMPGMDGLQATLRLRENKITAPIIILSAKGEDTDKITGLSFGADDYVTKPFSSVELVARVKSQIRRYKSFGKDDETDGVYVTGGLKCDTRASEVSVDGVPVKLTATEYGIVECLMRNMGRVMSTGQIYEAVWHEPSYQTEKTVTVHIRRIREKIEINPKEPKYLKVVWGIGYKIEKI